VSSAAHENNQAAFARIVEPVDQQEVTTDVALAMVRLDIMVAAPA